MSERGQQGLERGKVLGPIVDHQDLGDLGVRGIGPTLCDLGGHLVAASVGVAPCSAATGMPSLVLRALRRQNHLLRAAPLGTSTVACTHVYPISLSRDRLRPAAP